MADLHRECAGNRWVSTCLSRGGLEQRRCHPSLVGRLAALWSSNTADRRLAELANRHGQQPCAAGRTTVAASGFSDRRLQFELRPDRQTKKFDRRFSESFRETDRGWPGPERGPSRNGFWQLDAAGTIYDGRVWHR